LGYIFPEDKNAPPEDEEDDHHDHNHDHMNIDDLKGEEAVEGDDNAEAENTDKFEDEGFCREDREDCAKVYGESVWKNVFRSKGMIYIATQSDSIFTWQTSGIVNEIKHLGKWLSSASKEELFEKGHEEEYNSWEDKIQGDRKTQLVVIGSGLDKAGITKSLDDCLLSEEEYEKMKLPEGIVNYKIEDDVEDPFRPVEKEEAEELELVKKDEE